MPFNNKQCSNVRNYFNFVCLFMVLPNNDRWHCTDFKWQTESNILKPSLELFLGKGRFMVLYRLKGYH